jgi:hypothetical protein
MMSLVQDLSAWITETQRIPDLSDLLYALSILPIVFKVGLIVALLPLVSTLVWIVDTLVVPILLSIWRLDYSVVLSTLSTYVAHRLVPLVTDKITAVIAPLFWFVFTFVSWRQLHAVSHPILDGPAVHAMSRAKYRRHRQELRRTRCRSRVARQSIKTEGLHGKYPLNLRSMGRFVCKQQTRTVDKRRLVDEI